MKPLRLNGKLLDLNPQRPSFERIKSFLDKQSGDDLFTSDELIKRTGVKQLKDIGNHESLTDYTCRFGIRRLYGSTKAIAELKHRVGEL